MADGAVRDLHMSVGFEGVSAVKGLEGLNKKADETKESIQGIGDTASKIGATFQTQMAGMDKGFKLWETNAGKFTTTLERKEKRIGLLNDKTALLGKEIGKTSDELTEAARKFGAASEEAQQLENQLYDLKIEQAEYNNELKKLNGFNWDGFNKLGDSFTRIGGAMTAAVSVPLAGIAATGIKTSIELEDAFSGVEKTIDATGPQLDALRGKLNNLVTDGGIPVKVTEMYGIAEAAGQLGIQMDSIVGFSEVMAKLGTATNMTSEQAATDLARFANIVQMPQTNFDRLGATIVSLGNNLATTESEITSMSLRLSGAGAQIGLAESEILGFAGALSSVGIEAEAGGSAFSKVMIDMQNAVMSGGESLDIFAAVSGKSVEEFQTLFEKDAAGALVGFTEGLGSLQKSGFNTNEILEALGFSEIRVSDALRRAANSGDVFREAIGLGNTAWEENTALNDEAAKKYQTMASKIEVFKNKLTLLSEKIGGDLQGAFGGLLDVGTKIIDWLNGLDDGTRKTVVGIAMVVAAIGPVLLAVGAGIKAIKAMRDTMVSLGKGIKIIKTAFSAGGKAITFLTSPIGIALLAIGALVAIGYVLYKNWDKICSWFKKTFPDTFEKISAVVSAFKKFISDHIESFKGIFKGFTDFLDGVFTGNFTKAFGGLKDIFKNVGNILKPFTDAFKKQFPELYGFLEKTFGGIGEFFSTAFEKVKSVLTGFFKFGKSFISENIENFKNIFKGFTDFLDGLFSGNMTKAFGGLRSMVDNISTVFENLIAPLKDKFPAVFEFLSGALDNFKVTAEKVMGGLKTVFGGITGFFSGVFTGDWQKALSGLGRIFNGSFSIITSIAEGAFNNLIGFFQMLISPLKEKFPAVFDVLSNTLNIFKTTVSNIIGNLKTIFGGVVEFVKGIFSGNWTQAWGGITTILTGAVDMMKNIVSGGFSAIMGFFETLIAPLQEKFPFVFAVLSSGLNVFKDTVTSIIGNVQQIFGGLIDFVVGVFTGDWGRAWQGVKDVFGGIFSTLGDLLKAPLNFVISLINKAIEGINGISVSMPEWMPFGLGGKTMGFSIPQLPMLWKGTDNHIGGPAIVGEKGPEIVNLKKGSTVTPNDETNRLLSGIGHQQGFEPFTDKIVSAISRIGRRQQETMPRTYETGRVTDRGAAASVRQPSAGLMNKIEVTIQKIIVGGDGEIKPGASDSLKKEFKKLFAQAADEFFYEQSLKYPNLTEI